MKKSICILSFSIIAWDSRVLRQVIAARPFYTLTVAGYGAWDHPQDVDYIQIKQRGNPQPVFQKLWQLCLGKLDLSYFEKFYWGSREYREAYDALKGRRFDLIHANDLNALPLAVRLSREGGGKVLFDAHEYSPGQGYRNKTSEFFFKAYRSGLLKRFGPAAHAMLTVSEGIVALYKEKYNLQAAVIYNAPAYYPAVYRSVDAGRIRLVHHGLAEKSRSLDELIYLMNEVDERFSLDFYLIAKDAGYLQELQDIVRHNKYQRVTFHEALAPSDIPRTLNQYDLGIHLLRTDNLNHQNALPNKLFDFIMAGLGVIAYPANMMEKMISENEIGIVAQQASVESVASALNSLLPQQINRFKKNSLRLAKTLNAETESKKLLKIYSQLAG